jgi:hypothetical protein
MSARSLSVLILAGVLTGCSFFHHDPAAPASTLATPAPKKGFSLWPGKNRGPVDATPFIEYQRVRSETDKSSFILLARNTHESKTIEGDIRTTVDAGQNDSRMETSHFVLAPQETKKLSAYPDQSKMTYEVSAFFKE